MTTADPNDDIRFDRLTDGALSPQEYKSLLASLDDEPGGWRRCALAFLEAQAWRGELGAIAREPIEMPSPPQPMVRQSAAKPSPWKYPLMALAMAASFLLAFGLGLAARTSWFGDGAAPAGALAVDNAPRDSQENHPRASAHDSQFASDDGPLGNIQLVLEGANDGAGPRQVELPVYHIRHGGATYLDDNISALPPEIQQLLQHNGLQLLRERTLLPLELEGGQQMVVPVEDFKLVRLRKPPL
jgi:hypothetical protein